MDSDAGAIGGIIVVLVLFLLDFIFTAFSAALQSTGETELLELLEREGRSPDEFQPFKDDSERLLHTGWFLHALLYVVAGYLITTLASLVRPYVVFPLAVVVFYLFGSSLPEMFGRRNAGRFLLRRVHLVKNVMKLLSPFTYLMTALSHGCICVLGIDPKSLEPEVTEDEIISMVNEGHEQGVLDEREAEMIQNIFELDGKKASDVMTHRKNITAIDGTTNLHDAIAFMVTQTVSRFPVYEESIDNILGVLHFRDAMKFHTIGTYEDWLIKDIPELLRGVRFVPETRGIDRLFRRMQAEKLQMVIIIDEYGQTSGLVTMEDILEEIVGNIQDEYDHDVQYIRACPGGGYLMDGMTPLSDAADALGITFEEDEYVTLNGWVVSRLDRIPADGELARVKDSGYLFHILKAENKMICLVKITKMKEEEKE